MWSSSKAQSIIVPNEYFLSIRCIWATNIIKTSTSDFWIPYRTCQQQLSPFPIRLQYIFCLGGKKEISIKSSTLIHRTRPPRDCSLAEFADLYYFSLNFYTLVILIWYRFERSNLALLTAVALNLGHQHLWLGGRGGRGGTGSPRGGLGGFMNLNVGNKPSYQ